MCPKLSIWCQAIAHSFRLQALIHLKVSLMPTRQEVLEGFRVLAEEILASLRLLFQMLFTMTRATSPEETVSEQEMNPIHQLVAEVKSQRQKISELGLLITGQQMMQGHPTSPHRSSGPPSEIWEAIEMEGLGVPLMEEPGPSQAAPVLSSSPPRALNAQIYGGKQTMKNAGPPTSESHSQAAQAVPANRREVPAVSAESNNSQVALTRAALDSWGQRVITWGKKCKGQ